MLLWTGQVYFKNQTNSYRPHKCSTSMFNVISVLFLFFASSQQRGGGGVQCCYPYKFPSSVAKEPFGETLRELLHDPQPIPYVDY